MPLARFHHLTLDAVDVERAAAFWSAALGFERQTAPFPAGRPAGERIVLRGIGPQHELDIVPCTRERTAARRWHLDLHAESIDQLVALGGHVVDEPTPWVLLHCPEHREVGVLVTDKMSATDPDRLYQIVIDSPEPEAIAAWWARVLGSTLRPVTEDPDVAFIEPVPGAPFESLVFARESEPKTVPNSVWMTFTAYDTEPLELLGARVLARPEDGPVRMADPDGNEFAVIVIGRGEDDDDPTERVGTPPRDEL